MFSYFRIDYLSFFLGFLVATIFWWLVNRFKPLIPAVWALIKKFFVSVRQSNLEGVDEFLRRDTLRRAQRMHIAASMFALDEILIQPLVLAPPAPIEPDQVPPQESIAAQIVPYMPDWPELATNLGPISFPLGTALLNGCSIAVIGQPGSGKSVALAALACQFARKDPVLGDLRNYLPIHLHILDLDIDTGVLSSPLLPILKVFTPRVDLIYQPQLSRLISSSCQEGTAVLILDGLDELSPDALPLTIQYLKAIREKFPLLRMVITASPYHQTGVTSLGIIPLGITAWGTPKRNQFLDQWKAVWEKHIGPQIEKQSSLQTVSPLLIDNWLRGEHGYFTPLEWTARVWGAYAGDLRRGISPALETLIHRVSNTLPNQDLLNSLAQEFIHKGAAAIPYSDLVILLNSLAPAAAVGIEPSPEGTEPQPPLVASGDKKDGSKGKRDIILTVGEQALESMVKSGLLVEHRGSLIRFLTPVLTGYLAAPRLTEADISLMLKSPFWSTNLSGLRFITAIGSQINWVESFIKEEKSPLQENLLAAARWLGDSTGNTPWRAIVFRSLVNGLHNEDLPISLRARMITAFVCSNDPSALKLFKQLLSAKNPEIRLLAVLASGAIGDPALSGDLIGLLGDIESRIRNAACLALVALHTDSALSAVAECLLNGDESLRQAAAEALIFLPKEGLDIIREAAKLDDLLTRRAAVFGLMQIREPWTEEILQNIAVEDGQWVVRNAAAQALETIHEVDPRVPRPLPIPYESPWLLSFAGKRGIGLSAYQSPTNALLMALKTGTFEDQMTALRYLEAFPQEDVILAVLAAFFGDQPELKDAALRIVWHWTLGGVELPDPALFRVNY